jgi:hypothetical protein
VIELGTTFRFEKLQGFMGWCASYASPICLTGGFFFFFGQVLLGIYSSRKREPRMEHGAAEFHKQRSRSALPSTAAAGRSRPRFISRWDLRRD